MSAYIKKEIPYGSSDNRLSYQNENSINASVKYEMRATPRRRKDLDEQPLFLRKAYNMVSTCSPDMGGWTESGETFIIKDPKEFAEKVIPAFYKHNNFSSFVRQLNFYGFRKVKSANLVNPLWWEFRHPQFIRGQPHLLSVIKRTIHCYNEASKETGTGGQEITDLKSQVNSLKSQVAEMNDSIHELTGMVHSLMLKDSDPKSIDLTKPSTSEAKGRKRKSAKAAVQADVFDSSLHGSRYHLPTGPELSSIPLFRSDSQEIVNLPAESDVWDDDTLENLMAMEEETFVPTEPLPEVPMSANPVVNESIVSTNASMNAVDSLPLRSVNDITQLINSLSPDLQRRFVDKLAENMGAVLSSFLEGSNQTSSGAASNFISTIQSNPEPVAPIITPVVAEPPAIALPLASAALGAFVASLSKRNLHTHVAPRVNDPHNIHRSTSNSREIVQQSA